MLFQVYMLLENLILLPHPQGILTIYTYVPICIYTHIHVSICIYIHIHTQRERQWEGGREIPEIMLGK